MTILCVDLDGTLIRNDTLQLALWSWVGKNPLRLIRVVIWLMRGRAYLKKQIAARIALDPGKLPYNQPFLAWIKAEKSHGRKLVLVTATDQKFANAVGQYVGIFDEILASDGKTNLRSRNKAAELNRRYGRFKYDYAGNSSADLAVWHDAHSAIVVNANKSLLKRAEKVANIAKVFA